MSNLGTLWVRIAPLGLSSRSTDGCDKIRRESTLARGAKVATTNLSGSPGPDRGSGKLESSLKFRARVSRERQPDLRRGEDLARPTVTRIATAGQGYAPCSGSPGRSLGRTALMDPAVPWHWATGYLAVTCSYRFQRQFTPLTCQPDNNMI